MLKKLTLDEYFEIKRLVYQSPALNYFICMAYEDGLKAYDDIYALISDDDIKGAIFFRKSGNLQIAIDCCLEDLKDELKDFYVLINERGYNELIIPNSVFSRIRDGIPHSKIKLGAQIMKLERQKFGIQGFESFELKPNYNGRMITSLDIDEVVMLYERVFNSFAKREYMKSKLDSKRGVAYGIWHENSLIGVAQTDFNNLVIVGVAVAPEYRGFGIGRACMINILRCIACENNDIYLQVENPVAINLYKSMGFKWFDDVLHVVF